ncbi:hypothetical protein K493DRAFT_33230 [Basidiobolus meristosporus CBS 931.73]|uniref:PIN domain-containing protein n=1 Tax=Basidiobolus meristosporus CBS 931.73 TaxID=1314790 RepID=A0A1Y1Y7C1_9FUNG|nr:hypothetical protein K493DRAFT_33230 [Basidiobolus meristosporus CBS 931.73]|eukprot:ORX93911.1 hypothetical protein K493DRAFT_33230 [Basidiobolus meristosporus CBS 931.73]
MEEHNIPRERPLLLDEAESASAGRDKKNQSSSSGRKRGEKSARVNKNKKSQVRSATPPTNDTSKERSQPQKMTGNEAFPTKQKTAGIVEIGHASLEDLRKPPQKTLKKKPSRSNTKQKKNPRELDFEDKEVFSRGEKKGNVARLWAPDSQPIPHSNKKADEPPQQTTQPVAQAKPRETNRQAPERKEESPSPLQKYYGELKKLEQQVERYAEKVQYPDEWKKVQAFHNRLVSYYQKVIALDFEFSLKHDIEQKMWKLGFYCIIEKFRKLLQSDQDLEWNKRHLVDVFQTFLNHSGRNYANYLNRIQRNLRRYYESAEEHGQKRINQYKQSYHRSITFLGDIARYKAMYSGTRSKNWTLARAIYTKATALSPNNGKSYNQMAIISTYEKNTFDTIYFYYRSLSVPHPFIGARESLAIIFEQNRQRLFEQVGSKQQIEKLSATVRKKADKELFKSNGEGLQLLFDIFIRIQGILFTKISMETLPELRSLFLYLFKHTLNHKFGFTSIMNNEIVLKMELMNFFILYGVPVTEPPDFSSKDTMAFVTTFGFLLDFSLLIMESCGEELRNLDQLVSLVEDLASNERLMYFLQYMALLYKWLVSNVESWSWIIDIYDNDLIASTHQEFPQVFRRFWDRLAHVANALKKLSSLFDDNLLNEYDNLETQLLPESEFINGFAPLCESPPSNNHLYLESLSDLFAPFESADSESSEASDSDASEPSYEKVDSSERNSERLQIRVLSILRSLDYLAVITTPQVFRYDSFASKFESSLIDPLDSLQTRPRPTKTVHRVISLDITKPKPVEKNGSDHFSEEEEAEEEEEEKIDELEALNEMVEEIRKEIHSKISLESDDSSNDTIDHLKARKDELLRLTELHSRMQLEDSRKSAHRIRLKANYTIVIFDTNNFVSELRLIQRLHRTQKFVISVPLVVFTELEGLKKNTKSTLGPKAQRALEWLESEFLQQRAQSKSYLRAQTSKGNFLRDITLRNEVWYEQGESMNISARNAINDDIILQCCLYFIQNDQEPGHHNPVVLVTNDVNMRLKGYAKYVPVATVVEFRKRLRMDCGINISR